MGECSILPPIVTNSIVLPVLALSTVAASYGANYPMQPLSLQIRSWEEFGFSSTQVSVAAPQEWQATLSRFAHKLLSESVDPDPDFDEFVAENFWDLV